MADNTENQVLKHLKALRNELKDFCQEMREELQTIKLCLGSVERGFARTHDDIVIIQLRLDSVDSRIDRIEKRLDLTAA